MNKKTELEHLSEALDASFPVLGAMRRRGTIAKLALRRNEAACVPLLIKGLRSTDLQVAASARSALTDLSDQAAIDSLCAVWSEDWDSTLGVIIAQRGYVAVAKVESRVASGLKNGRMDKLVQSDAAAVQALISLRNCPDRLVAANAEAALRQLKNSAGIDALCGVWAEGRDATLATIVSECSYVAAKPTAVRVLSALQADAKTWLTSLGKGEAEALTAVLGDQDSALGRKAESVLKSLKSQDAIDAVCAIWAQNRDIRLGTILTERKFVAAAPLSLRILTALKCQGEAPANNAEDLEILIGLLGDKEPVVQAGAKNALGNLTSRAVRDAICELAIRDSASPITRICAEKGYRPSDPERDCVFLFVTRQLDLYFKESEYGKDDFQTLRLAYDRADDKLKARIMDVASAGDRRCQAFILKPRKALNQCTQAEIKQVLLSCVRHQSWEHLFNACLELPLKYSFPTLDYLRKSKWSPSNRSHASVFEQMLEDSENQRVEASKVPSTQNNVFERWLAKGRDQEYARIKEADLLQQLQSATPPEGVPIVAALAAHKSPSEAALNAVQKSEHWLIRLAGLATGLTPNLVGEGAKDPNYWINELAGSAEVLEFWPEKATPKDLERLNSAPAEAFAGKLGAARKVLRILIGYHLSNRGIFAPMEVQVDQTTGEFEFA